MNQIIKPGTVDFNTLIKTNTTLTLDCQSKMINILNKEFTEEENRWYTANLYIYMNYHPTNDFPINLDTLVKLVDFANKQNAKRTLVNNFTKDEDYKILLIPKDEQKNADEEVLIPKDENLNANKTILIPKDGNKITVETRGRPKEQIMMNIDTFKNMCMLVKTEKSKDIRKYYVKLENIYNKIVKEEIEEQKILLAEKDQLLIEQRQVSSKEKEQIWINSFRNKYVVYLIIISEFIIKFGFTKNIDKRLSAHKTDYGKDIKIAFILESKNNEMLETLFKNHENIKSNIVSQEFNGENKTELIKLDKNISLKNVINVLKETNKVIDTIIETDVLRKYNVNVLETQEQDKSLPVQQIQYQSLQELAKEKTKQMEIQLEILKLQQVQPILIQPPIQEQHLEENLSEELQFHKWLNENVSYTIGNILIWKEVTFKLMNKRVGSGVSSKYKGYFENWCEIKFPNVNDVTYKVHRTDNGSVRGYTNFNLKDN